MTEQSDIISVTEVAKMFGVNFKTVSRWAKAGKLPHFVTPGGRVKFHRANIERVLKQNTHE